MVEVADFDDLLGTKVVEKREKQIIRMMKECGMKEEVAHLFRKMSVMPSSRRMSVMPGVRFTDDSKVKRVIINADFGYVRGINLVIFVLFRVRGRCL